MSDQTRALPEQPNLRFLKLEAKRRLAAGEFATLHDAQLAVAREHGLSSWAVLRETVLKETVTAEQAEQNLALAQVRWVISRFGDADRPTWGRPAAEELGDHFTERFLAAVPAHMIVGTLVKAAPMFREDLVVIENIEGRHNVRAEIGGLRVDANAEPDPPHRLGALQVYRLSQFVADERVAAPPVLTDGPVPGEAMAAARESFEELGLVGLVVAGADTGTGTGGGAAKATDAGGAAWRLALGWADLDRPEPLGFGHRFPTNAITMVVTATAVLRLVGGRVAAHRARRRPRQRHHDQSARPRRDRTGERPPAAPTHRGLARTSPPSDQVHGASWNTRPSVCRSPDRITDTPCLTGAADQPRAERTGRSLVVNT